MTSMDHDAQSQQQRQRQELKQVYSLNQTQLAGDLLAGLGRQRINGGRLCDVSIYCPPGGASSVRAHRCVLAASSEYFETLYASTFDAVEDPVRAAARLHVETSTDGVVRHVVEICLPAITCDVMQQVVDFMYSGDISLSFETVEKVLRVADFLRMPKLLKLCIDCLDSHIGPSTCLYVKQIVDTYVTLSQLSPQLVERANAAVTDQLPSIFTGDSILDLPADVIRELMQDPMMGTVREQDVFEAVCRFISASNCSSSSCPGDSSSAQFCWDLLGLIEYDLLPKPFLRDRVMSNHNPVLSWLERNCAEQMDVILGKLSGNDNVADVVICKSRASQVGRPTSIRLLIYVINDDEWWQVKLCEIDESEMQVDGSAGRDADNSRMLCGLQSMVISNGWLYILCSLPADVSSYVGEPTEMKRFIRINLNSGRWEILLAPTVVKFTCRLAACVDGIYATDRAGRVELYSVADGRWTVRCRSGFPSGLTLYVLPMPVGDGRLLAMRSFSSGYSFQFASKSLSLLRLDPDRPDWKAIERSEIEYHDLFTADHDVNFHGYTISPGVVTLRDELDRSRVEFDFSIGDWRQTNFANVNDSRPEFVGDILGSTVHAGRLYCVAESKKTGGPCRLFTYNQSRQHFKILCPPPMDLSGLLCRATLIRSNLELLATRCTDSPLP